MMKQKAIKNGAYETILAREEMITEGTSSNVFIVKDGVILTHPANHLILNGITRQVAIPLAESLGIEVIENSFTVEDLLAADEVFTTSSISEIMPIISVNDQPIGDGKPGKITKIIQKSFIDTVNNFIVN